MTERQRKKQSPRALTLSHPSSSSFHGSVGLFIILVQATTTTTTIIIIINSISNSLPDVLLNNKCMPITTWSFK